MRLRIDFAATVAKDSACPELNEDAWAANTQGTCFALCDGASISYDSQRWARLLAERYAKDPAFVPSWVDAAVAEYAAQIDRTTLSWSRQAAFDRGSFSSLLGLQLADNHHEVEVLAVGDSVACHVRAGRLLASYPYSDPEQFDQRPTLLSTRCDQNAFVLESDFYARNTSNTWAVEPGDRILLLTDAIGQWLLRELAMSPSSISVLESVDSPDALRELTLQLRAEGRMRIDDTTVLKVTVSED
jgi:hypothetical protein